MIMATLNVARDTAIYHTTLINQMEITVFPSSSNLRCHPNPSTRNSITKIQLSAICHRHHRPVDYYYLTSCTVFPKKKYVTSILPSSSSESVNVINPLGLHYVINAMIMATLNFDKKSTAICHNLQVSSSNGNHSIPPWMPSLSQLLFTKKIIYKQLIVDIGYWLEDMPYYYYYLSSVVDLRLLQNAKPILIHWHNVYNWHQLNPPPPPKKNGPPLTVSVSSKNC